MTLGFPENLASLATLERRATWAYAGCRVCQETRVLSAPLDLLESRETKAPWARQGLPAWTAVTAFLDSRAWTASRDRRDQMDALALMAEMERTAFRAETARTESMERMAFPDPKDRLVPRERQASRAHEGRGGSQVNRELQACPASPLGR